ncbi:unnamed protein product [Bursaphelenchus okinawaensis]|uniref:G-patch domain-containing protein n=1 Tax=Bursaphelenchus okinawaensis TaxID=465554 RepID=A0A811KAE7_9BILA|nr:unnamed protein product [Bursaphelenchus okinawaensis]CAG9099573.1 unnamed protein product [Bursaphelenchus okinawaensis]
MSLAKYGTAHENLEDEKHTAVSRKPTAVQDEVVTDEKGRRRFHGAFTGGFSAGYFNTVGSKHGWVPQTFTSSRTERSEQQKQSIYDYMDEEDTGEFGFAHQKIRTKSNFMSQLSEQGQSSLAWERAGPSTSGNLNDIEMKLVSTFQGVNDSIGVKILKSMGWRPGKGIGPRMKRRQLERLKVNDAHQQGIKMRYDEKDVEAMEEIAPEAEYAPDDIPKLLTQANKGEHGIGYIPLEQSNVLNENFLMKVDAYKEKRKSKGNRGQAFGVGAFEEDDDDIYTSEDISKYDFAIGGEESEVKEVKRYDTAFVPSKVVERQKVYSSLEPSKHFDQKHRPSPIILKDTVSEITTAFQNLNPLQKAVFLGDRSGSVLELLSSSDREKLKLLTKKSEIETKFKKPEKEKRVELVPFEEEPMKAHRFKKFVHYLKSGHVMPTPNEMTVLEWEEEQKEFENHLTPELRSLLPSVRDRQQPLAKLETAQPIADMLKNRFQSENSTKIKEEPTSLMDNKKLAVQQKQFGPLTRQKYTWHPSKYLVKYFNVEDPYPDSREEGCPDIIKKSLTKRDYSLDMLGLPSTEKEVIEKINSDVAGKRRSRWDGEKGMEESKPMDKTFEPKLPETEKPTFLPPLSLLQAVFEQVFDDDDSDQEVHIIENDDVRGANENNTLEKDPIFKQRESRFKNEPSLRNSIDRKQNLAGTQRNSVAAQHKTKHDVVLLDDPMSSSMSKPVHTSLINPETSERYITVLDLVESDDEYGPKIPNSFAAQKTISSSSTADIVELRSSDGIQLKKKRRRKDSLAEETKNRKKHKKEKRKKEKKHKRHD